MKKQTPGGKSKFIYSLVFAVIGWFALLLQLFIIIDNAVDNCIDAAAEIVRFFSYFTVLTNLLTTLCFTYSLFTPTGRAGKFFTRPVVLAGAAVYMAVVGIVYSLLLRNIWNPQGWQLTADRLLHDVMPVVFILYWIFMVPKSNLKWRVAISWLIYPAAYVIFVLVRGNITGQYPYPFIDVAVLGYPVMLKNSLLMLAGFIVIGLLFVWIDRVKQVKPVVI